MEFSYIIDICTQHIYACAKIQRSSDSFYSKYAMRGMSLISLVKKSLAHRHVYSVNSS